VIHLIELADKKMIGFFDDHDFVFAGRDGNHAFQFVRCSVNVIRTKHKELRFCTLRQIRKIRIVHRRAQPDQLCDSRILATGAKPHPATKAESRNEKRNAWEFGSKKIQRRANVAALPFAAIVLPFAQTRSTKIETQYGKPKRVQRFCGLIDHFVVHRPAKQRMRMTHQRGQTRRTSAGTP